MIDITELSKMSKHLEQSRKSYRYLFQSSMDGIFYVDSDGYFLEVNNAFCSMLRYSENELLGTNISELVTYDLFYDADLFQNQIEMDIKRKDGSKIVVSPRIWEHAENGSNQGYWGIVRDITQSKKIEKMLIESQMRYDLAVRGSSDGLWDWDIINDITWFSPRLLEMLEIKPEEFVNNLKFLSDRVHPDDIEIVLQHLNDYLEGKCDYKVDYRILTGSGNYRWFLTRGSAVFDIDGNPYRMAGSLQDIDDIKKAEEKEKRYIEELKRSNGELQQFAYVASHDLQEPLRMISSFLQLIYNRYIPQLDIDAKEFIEFAIDGSNRLQQMINDLLAYSRIHSRGKAFLENDINKILNKSINTLSENIKSSGASIYFDIMPEKALCDEMQIFQLFMNLISNAIKFAKPDIKPEIVISCEEEEKYFRFKVRDNGIGFDEKYNDRIFQIFQRLHTREEYAGTGIGLSICQRIVNRHSGEISVESVIGEGSLFTFTLSKNPRSNIYESF